MENTEQAYERRTGDGRRWVLTAAAVMAIAAIAAMLLWPDRTAEPEGLISRLPAESRLVATADAAMLQNSAAAPLLEALQRIAEKAESVRADGTAAEAGTIGGIVREHVERMAVAGWPDGGERTAGWVVILEGDDAMLPGEPGTEPTGRAAWILERADDGSPEVAAVRIGNGRTEISEPDYWSRPEAAGTGPDARLADAWNSTPEGAWLRGAFAVDRELLDTAGATDAVADVAGRRTAEAAMGAVTGGRFWSTVKEGTEAALTITLALTVREESELRNVEEVVEGLTFLAAAALAMSGRTPGSGIPGTMGPWSPGPEDEGPPATGLRWVIGIEEAMALIPGADAT